MGWNLIDDHPKVKIGSSQGAAIKIDQNLYVAILAMMRFICSSSIFFSCLQAFLDFRSFDFRDFLFTTVYNSIQFSSPLVLLSNPDLRSFCFPWVFYVSTY